MVWQTRDQLIKNGVMGSGKGMGYQTTDGTGLCESCGKWRDDAKWSPEDASQLCSSCLADIRREEEEEKARE